MKRMKPPIHPKKMNVNTNKLSKTHQMKHESERGKCWTGKWV